MFLEADYVCEYCPKIFETQSDRVNHTPIHFINKLCLTCNKTLIRINNDWYEIHHISNCIKQKGIARLQKGIALGENFTFAQYIDDDNHSVKSEADSTRSDADDALNKNDEVLDTRHDSPRDLDTVSVTSATQDDGPNNQNSGTEDSPVDSAAKMPTDHVTKAKAPRTIKPTASLLTKRKKKPRGLRRKRLKKRQPQFIDHRPTGETTCDICNKKLRSFITMRSHMRNIHTKERGKRVKCNECGQTFSSAGNLNSHKRIHFKSKAFVCTYCGRGFNQLHNLNEHTNRHTGEKPYKCDSCDKTFSRRTSLTAHCRVHTGEKPYVCKIEQCGRAYMFGIDLKRHHFSVHGIYTKKHVCPICSKVYSENKLLKKHLESHSTALR